MQFSVLVSKTSFERSGYISSSEITTFTETDRFKGVYLQENKIEILYISTEFDPIYSKAESDLISVLSWLRQSLHHFFVYSNDLCKVSISESLSTSPFLSCSFHSKLFFQSVVLVEASYCIRPVFFSCRVT